MKEQAILREEMNYLFKIGNVEVGFYSNETSQVLNSWCRPLKLRMLIVVLIVEFTGGNCYSKTIGS